MPLPILKLPLLNSIEVIDLLEPVEQLSLSLTSRRTHNFIEKVCNKFKKFQLEVSINGATLHCEGYDTDSDARLKVRIKPTDSQMLSLSLKGTECHVEPSFCTSFYMDTYWMNLTVGMITVVDYCTSLFHVKSITIERSRAIFRDDVLRHILNMTEPQEIHVYCTPSVNFSMENWTKHFEFFESQCGTWLTPANLMALDCVELQVIHKTFSCQDLNLFLKAWINGEKNRLKFFLAEVEEYSEEVLIEGITLVPGPGSRKYTSPYGTTRVFNGMKIQQTNGVKASVQYYPFIRAIAMGVWPDALGNQ